MKHSSNNLAYIIKWSTKTTGSTLFLFLNGYLSEDHNRHIFHDSLCQLILRFRPMVVDTSIMCHLINKVLQFDHLVFIVQLVANHPLKL